MSCTITGRISAISVASTVITAPISSGGFACYHSAYTINSTFADADYTGGFTCTYSVGKCNRADTGTDYTISFARAYSVNYLLHNRQHRLYQLNNDRQNTLNNLHEYRRNWRT